MAGEDPYLPGPGQYFDGIDPLWDTFQNYQMPSSASIRTADGPYLQITEQPKQRGFRFRYGCEGPSHGGLPGAYSEKNRKSFPTVKICNYQGMARVVVPVTNTTHTHLHAHSLWGSTCDKGICIADLQPKDSTISFPNLGILHVTKKNVSRTLEERMTEAYRMGYNCGLVIDPEIDSYQGEVRSPRELTDHQRNAIVRAAASQSKEMDLSVVRLMFTAFLLDSDGGFSRRLDPVISDCIFDSKAPNASNLKIVRIDQDRQAVWTGGEEVYLLCDKVQKDDIQVRFYEEDDGSGASWEALGDFSPTDVHRQFAIVFKTPKYRNLHLQKPTSVLVQLKRKSDNETSDPKPFTYHPQIIDKEEVQRKRQKTLPNFHDFSGGSGGGMYRGGNFFQGYPGYNNYGNSSYGFSSGMGGGGGTGIKHTGGSGEEGLSDHSDPHQESGLRGAAQPQAQEDGETGEVAGPGVEPAPDTACVCEDRLAEVAKRQVEALFQYAVTGDARYLLVPHTHLITAQDEDGDTGLHLGVIHSQSEAVRSLAQVLCAWSGEEGLDIRNYLYQTPLHLAVITQQKEAVEALLLAGADVTLRDRYGNTALHLAAQQKEGGDMMELLLQHRQVAPLVDLPNAAGVCALHLAVLANSLRSLRALLTTAPPKGAPHQGRVEVQERSWGRTALHLATEMDNVSLAGCLLLEGNATVDCCTYDGSTPLHIAAGRGSVKLTALLMAAGADPHKENFEPLFFPEDRCGGEEEEDEGYIPGTTPFNLASTPEVLEILKGKEYEPVTPAKVFISPQGDMSSLGADTKRALCLALEGPLGGWQSLAHTLGLGILNSAFQLSPSPAGTLLDSYEVSGGTVKDLEAGLRTLGNHTALSLLQEALCRTEQEDAAPHSPTDQLDLKLDLQIDSGVCDSGVELSTA
ncbi:LOW QUALITY PROTEIN: nuclear factor NF-kappa-B p105 subunit [Aplochiton taeniatus]